MSLREVVRVESLCFSYRGGGDVLRDVSLSVQKGEFVGIIGPNGAGKTTLIKLLLGLLGGFRGRIYLFGKDIKTFREWHRIGYVPQRTRISALNPVSVEELLRSTAKDDRILNDLVEFLHMEELMNRQFRRLSGGQQQLVLLGMALASEPELLVLDEPTAGLDIHSQEHIMEILSTLSSEEGKTILMVSHNLGMLFSNVSRVIAIDRTVKYDGSVENLDKIIGSLFGLHERN
jgi:zinc transport system ATP-binding protein